MTKRQHIIILLLSLLLYVCCAGVFSSSGYAWVPDIGPAGPVWPPKGREDREPTHINESPGSIPPRVQTPKVSPTHRTWNKKSEKAKLKLTKEIIRISFEQSPVKPQYIKRVRKRGRVFFGFKAKERKLEAKIPVGETPPTRFAPENLRRAISILGAIPADPKKLQYMNIEDAKFIADQAGLAMFGAPLQVAVPHASESFGQRSRIDELVKLANEIDRDITNLQNIKNGRRRLEDELLKIEEQIRKVNIQTSGKDPILPQARNNFQELKDEYIKVRENENSAHEDLRKKQKGFHGGVEQHFN